MKSFDEKYNPWRQKILTEGSKVWGIVLDESVLLGGYIIGAQDELWQSPDQIIIIGLNANFDFWYFWLDFVL